MFDSPPPPDQFKEGVTVSYNPPPKTEEDVFNPYEGGSFVPDSLATTLDQVLANHASELGNVTQKEYSEVFSEKTLFEWSDRKLLKEFFDNFSENNNSQREVVLARDSSGNFFMILSFEAGEEGNTKLVSYQMNNIPASLVEEYLKSADIRTKTESADGYIVFSQKFPKTTYLISGKSSMFPKDPSDDFFYPFGYTLSITEKREI